MMIAFLLPCAIKKELKSAVDDALVLVDQTKKNNQNFTCQTISKADSLQVSSDISSPIFGLSGLKSPIYSIGFSTDSLDLNQEKQVIYSSSVPLFILYEEYLI